MSYLNVVNTRSIFEGALPEHPFKFELDNFQKYAISAISKNENVLVTAKTGSGKTLVGEYQIHHSLSKGGRIFYTTPIKSLSNQKFHDLKKIYGDRVGIITGDIKFNPLGDILIMTTEILRNLLYKLKTSTENLGTTSGVSLEGLDAVIFDEVHYINDPERGKVWEETLIMLPKDVNLVLLSATIDNPEAFASWLGEIKQKTIHCISTEYRIIPLHHYVIDNQWKLCEIMDHKNNFDSNTYRLWLRTYNDRLKNYDDFKERVKSREEGQVVSEGKVRLVSYQHTINETIEILKHKNLLPALFFVFSRAGCERFAHNVQGSLIDASDAAAVRHIISFHLHRYMDKLEHLSQYHTLHDLLCRGVAFHHSGMLPILKEIVEILFNKNFIKVLFATETFAVGINMPTKTVVFTDLKKFDDKCDNLRVLRTDEYLQMAGRAGRRGIDTVGTVIYLPMKKPEELNTIRSMMTGKNSSVESKMQLDYDMILKSLHSPEYSYDNTYKNSYLEFQRNDEMTAVLEEIKTLKNKQSTLNFETHLEDLQFRKSLEIELKITRSKEAQSKLNVWNNKHVGPKWIALIKLYEEYLKFQKEIDDKEASIDSINYQEEKMRKQKLEYLANWKFIDYDPFSKRCSITAKGVLATEINQMNCLLFTEAYTQNQLLLDKLSASELAAIVSCFEIFNSNDKELQQEIPLGNLGYAYRNLEMLKKRMATDDSVFWYLNYGWCQPILDWTNGVEVDAICRDYAIFPGNLIKTVLFVISCLDELIVVGTLESDITLLEKATEAKKLMMRDIVVADSLYLRL